MSNMDYDKSEPKHTPIILYVTITIIFIIVMTGALVYFFKGQLKSREDQNYMKSGNYIELDEIRDYEDTFLNESNDGKITVDEAITIINNNYN